MKLLTSRHRQTLNGRCDRDERNDLSSKLLSSEKRNEHDERSDIESSQVHEGQIVRRCIGCKKSATYIIIILVVLALCLRSLLVTTSLPFTTKESDIDVGPPPPFVEFDLRGDETAAKVINEYMKDPKNKFEAKHPRDAFVHFAFNWQRNPASRALAEHPILLRAARKVMGLSATAPVYLSTVKFLGKRKGSVHRLHSDMEFDTPECRPRDGAVLWILLNTECPNEGSPLTLVAGSHELEQNAHQELVKRKCWSLSQSALPCNVEQVIREVEMGNENKVHAISGPTQPLTGIAWPTTAWHMTKDKCKRQAVTVGYTASLSCARSLQHRYPAREIGQFMTFPDRNPFVPLGSTDDITEYNSDIDSLDYLHRIPTTTKSGDRCYDLPPPPDVEIQKAQFISNNDTIHMSGKYVAHQDFMTQNGITLNPRPAFIKTKRFLIHASKVFFNTTKQANTAHRPHVERTLEICAVVKGRLNYAMSTDCDEYYDVFSARKGHVVVLFPGIFHTNSPDAKEDGEHMCFKIFPLRGADGEFRKAVKASRKVTSILTDWDRYFETKLELPVIPVEKRDENIFDVPGYRRVHAKVVKYNKSERFEVHVNEHDLIVLTIVGSIVIEHGDTTFPLPENQYAFVPAGVPHGFDVRGGPALILFVEIA